MEKHTIHKGSARDRASIDQAVPQAVYVQGTHAAAQVHCTSMQV
jgi:hypothetical protein